MARNQNGSSSQRKAAYWQKQVDKWRESGLGATDMRKAINGLSLIVVDCLERDAFSGHLFAFCNRGRTIIKILYWDRNGFCLWQKRLEKHRFCWPKSEEDVQELDHRELGWLLEGLDPKQMHGHTRLVYSDLA